LGAKGHGVAGFDEVLAALTNHQLKTMLVDRNYRVPGWRCKDCDWVAPTHAEHCASCVGGVVPVADAVGELVRLAVLGNAFVEVAEDIPLLDDLAVSQGSCVTCERAAAPLPGSGAAAHRFLTDRTYSPSSAAGNQSCRERKRAKPSSSTPSQVSSAAA